VNDFTERINLSNSKNPTKIVTEEDFSKLCDKFQRLDYEVAARMAFRGGFRLHELTELKWSQINNRDSSWMVEIEEKRSRKVPLVQDTLQEKLSEMEALVAEQEEKEGDLFNFSHSALRRKLNQISDGEIRPYTLRWSAAFNLANDGFEASELREMFGWAEPEKAERFIEAEKVEENKEVKVCLSCIDCGEEFTKHLHQSTGELLDWSFQNLFCKKHTPERESLSGERIEKLRLTASKLEALITQPRWKCPCCVMPEVVTYDVKCPECGISLTEAARVKAKHSE
jgi:hypothetical protein